MSDKIDAAVLEFTVKGEQAVSTFGRIEDAAEKMETAAKRSADRTADSIAGIGKGAAANAFTMEAGSRRFIAALEQEANRVSMTRAEYKRWQAEARGIPKEIYDPLIKKIEQATTAQAGLAKQVEASRPAFDSLKNLIGGLAAGLVAGFSAHAFTGMVKGAIDAAEALNDLSIKSGLSVERLSALAKLGLTTSTSADAITQATNRLAKGMAVANEESAGTAQAIKALGLDFDRFKALRPDDQLLTLAKAMGEFEDGSAKSAIAMTLLGKSGADLLPFLKDLADANELVATTTAEQASMADRFNDGMTIAGARVADLQRSFALGLLPTMIEMLDTTTALADVFGGRLAGELQRADERADGMSVSAQALGTVLETLMSLGADVSFVFQGIGRDLGGMAAQMVKLGTLDFAGFAAIRESLLTDAEKARAELDAYQARLVGTTARMAEAARIVAQYGISNKEAADELTRLAGRMGEATKKTLEFSAAKEKATQKSTADPFAAEREAAKSWAKVLEEAAKIEEDATGKTLGLSKAQQALLGYLSSPAYATNSEEMRQMAVAALIAAHNAEQLGESHKRTAALVSEANGNYSKFIAELQRGVDGVESQVVAMQDEAKAAQIAAERRISLAEAIQLVTIARLREKQAALDIPDAGAYSAIEREIEARERLLGLIRSKAATDANAEAARQQGDLWSQIASDAGQALSNALMEGGKDAGDYLKGYFRSLFGRELAAMFTSAIGSFGQYIGLASSARGGGGTLGQFASASGGMPQGNTLNTLYGAYNVAAGYLGYGGATAGAAAGTLAYANAVGAVGGDAIGALYAANNGWAGVAAGNSLGAAAAGEGVAAGSGAAAGAGGAATAIPVIGWIVAAVLASLAAYKGGATHDMLSGSYSRYATPGGSIAGSHYKVFKALGMSEKWATVLSGEALVSRLLGHKQSISGYGVGTVQDGDFVQGTSAPLQFGANTLKGGADPFLQNLSSDIAAAVTLAASSFGGGLTNGLRVGAVTDRDRENEVASLLGFFGADNKLLAGVQTGSGAFGAGGPGQAASKIAAGDLSKWIGEQMPILIIQGLQQSDLEDRFDAYFDSIAANTLTSEQATQFLNTAGAVQQLADAFGPLGGAFAQFDTLSVKAVASTAEAAGGFDALISSADAYYQRYFTEAERTTIATGRVREVLAGLGLAMPDVAQGADAARMQWRALVDVQDLSTEAGRQAFTTLLGVAGAFDEVVTAADAAAEAAAEAAKKLGDVITESITRFGTPGERQGSTFGSIATDLQRDAGVSFSIGQLMGASLADIEAFARGFITVSTNSDAAKTAVLGAANALFDLKTKASDKSGSLQVELLKAQGHALEAVNLERKAEIAQLAALEASLGVAAGTFTDFQRAIYAANDAAAAVARQKSLLAGVDSVVGDFLSGSELSNYFGARIQQILAGGGIDASVATILGSTRGQVLELFQAVGIDGKEAILEALPLWEQMRKAIDGTSDTIASFVKDLQRFTGSLKFSDLSPLSAEAQLTAAQSLYETTLAKAQAGDQDARAAFTGVAQAYLQEAQGAFASGKAYTDIFNKVLGDSDALAIALSGGTSALTTALTKGGSTGGTTATTPGTSTSATGTDSALQIQGASSVTAVYDSEVTKVLLEIDDWNRSIVQTFLLGEHGFIADLLRSIDAKMGGDPAGHADALASALSSAPTDRTFIEGPAGSSGGLSGPKRGQYIDIPQSLGNTPGGDQTALLEQVNSRLGEVVARLERIANTADANASVDQQGFMKATDAINELRVPLDRLAGTAQSAAAKAAVMPPRR